MPGRVITLIDNRAILIGSGKTPAYSLIRSTGSEESSPTPWIDVRRFRDFHVSVDIATFTGSGPSFNLWVQATIDDWRVDPDPANWRAFDLPYTKRIRGTATAADVTASASKRNILVNESAANRWGAVYRRTGVQFVRLWWSITGGFTTGQGATTSASLWAK